MGHATAVIVTSMTMPFAPPSSAPVPPSPPPPSPPPSSPHPSSPPPDRPPRTGGGDRSRAGARWITATGAFLLLAAAAVFVAVRWNQLPEEAKLGILGALTGGFLVAGRRFRRELPGTCGVLYHLGAFLVPVNVAAVALSRDLAWPVFVLVEGLVATGAWWLLNRPAADRSSERPDGPAAERSAILSGATAGAAVVALAGASATLEHQFGFTVPAALLVAVAAVAAEVRRRHGVAIAWAMVAGGAPVLALAERALPLGTDVLDTLGLSGSTPHLTAVLSGALAAAVLGRNARRRSAHGGSTASARAVDLVLVACAAVSAGLGLMTSWIGLAPGPDANLVGLATLFLSIEVVAHGVRRDPFWARPGSLLATVTEGLALAGAGVALLVALAEHWLDPRLFGVAPLVAGAIAAAAWFVADLRRRSTDEGGTGIALLVGAGWAPATVGMAVALMAGLLAAAPSGDVVAIVAVALAGLLVLSGRSGGHAVAAVLIITGPLFATHPAAIAGAGLSGALVLAAAAVVRSRIGDPALGTALAGIFAVLALEPLAAATIQLGALPRVDHLPGLVLLVGTLLATWLVAGVLDLGETGGPRRGPAVIGLGLVGRVGGLLVLAAGLALEPADLAILAGLAAGLAVLDAVRRNDALPLFGLAVSAPLMVGATTFALSHRMTDAGIALCLLAAVATGVAMLLPRRFVGPMVAVIAMAAVNALLLTSPDPGAFSTALILLGGVGLAGAAAAAEEVGALIAWGFVTAGVWGHLVHGDVGALDAYVAPVAIALLVVGLRSPRLSSWVAYGPAIVLLGGAALAERLDGGAGVHALVAGAVALAAVLVGGTRRLIAPLLIGTALLVALTAHESLGVTRQVPTWAWLAAGGTVLLAVGVIMDRRDTGPVETGRRVIDVVHERFS